VGFWVKRQGSGTIVSKANYYSITCDTSGVVTATIVVGGTQRTVTASGLDTNVWKHVAMTYDNTGKIVKLYINGTQRSSLTISSGTLVSNGSPLVLGTNFTGRIDELNIWSRVLSAAEITGIYNAAPNIAPNQPKTPEPIPSNLYSGKTATQYTFKFNAFDVNGDSISYRIDWGDGSIQTTGMLANNTILQSTHSWTVSDDTLFNIKVQAIDQNGATSVWSPEFPITIAPQRSTQYSGHQMIGNSAGYMVGTSSRIAGTIGEAVTGKSSSSRYTLYNGYQGGICGDSTWWSSSCGQSDPGGTETPPPAHTIINVAAITSLTSTNDIVQAINQNINRTIKDANGNMVITNNRWIKYDYDNRPIKIVTQSGNITEYVYDYQGQRVMKKTATAQGVYTSTTVYIGTIYEAKSTGEQIQSISAGNQQVAIKSSTDGVLYIHGDHLNSTSLMTNASGAVVRTTKYAPFGTLSETSGTKDASRKFTGQILDDDTGLYYYNARYYDPLLGTFITADDIVQDPYDPQTLNRYAYCRNNPIIYSDPSGHIFGIDDAIFIGICAAAGGVYGGTHGFSQDLNRFDWNAAGQGALAGAAIGAALVGVNVLTNGALDAFGKAFVKTMTETFNARAFLEAEGMPIASICTDGTYQVLGWVGGIGGVGSIINNNLPTLPYDNSNDPLITDQTSNLYAGGSTRNWDRAGYPNYLSEGAVDASLVSGSMIHYDNRGKPSELIHIKRDKWDFRFNRAGEVCKDHLGRYTSRATGAASKALKYLKNVNPEWFIKAPLLIIVPPEIIDPNGKNRL
jgi:RHS repeat-associated protein